MVESLPWFVLFLFSEFSSELVDSIAFRFVLSSFERERCRLWLRRSCREEDDFRRFVELSSWFVVVVFDLSCLFEDDGWWWWWGEELSCDFCGLVEVVKLLSFVLKKKKQEFYFSWIENDILVFSEVDLYKNL